jgi:hypothetical protein
MAVGDHYRVQFNYSVNGRPCSNVTVWQMLDQPTIEDEAGDLLAAFSKDILPEFQSMQSNEVVYLNSRCWPIDADKPPAMSLYPTTTGSIVDKACPANKNMKFTFRQVVYSARLNGELRLAGIPEGDTTGNTYTGVTTRAAPIAALIGHFTNNITSSAPASGSYRLVIESNSPNLVPPPPPKQYLDVVSCSVAGLVYSDRRRSSRLMGTSV